MIFSGPCIKTSIFVAIHFSHILLLHKKKHGPYKIGTGSPLDLIGLRSVVVVLRVGLQVVDVDVGQAADQKLKLLVLKTVLERYIIPLALAICLFF